MFSIFKKKRYQDAEMVQYWKNASTTEAKITRNASGHYEMQMAGEKYPFPGFPRSILLYGKLSSLKHWIKNKVFNDVWAMLEERASDSEVWHYLETEAFPYIFNLGEGIKYDMLPFERLVPPMKELYRALTVSGIDPCWRDIIVFTLQEDDAYRMRFQWMMKFLPTWSKPTLKDWEKAFSMAEHAEIIGDMKERQRLVKRVFMFLVKDSAVFQKFSRALDVRKMRLSNADKYFFRAKYFKVDYPEYQY